MKTLSATSCRGLLKSQVFPSCATSISQAASRSCSISPHSKAPPVLTLSPCMMSMTRKERKRGLRWWSRTCGRRTGWKACLRPRGKPLHPPELPVAERHLLRGEDGGGRKHPLPVVLLLLFHLLPVYLRLSSQLEVAAVARVADEGGGAFFSFSSRSERTTSPAARSCSACSGFKYTVYLFPSCPTSFTRRSSETYRKRPAGESTSAMAFLSGRMHAPRM